MRKQRITAGKRIVLISLAVFLLCHSVPVYGHEENREETALTQEEPSEILEEGEEEPSKEAFAAVETPATEEISTETFGEPAKESPAAVPAAEETFTEASEEPAEESEAISREDYQEAGEAQEPVYRIMYQAHAQSYGWMDWAPEGEWAGTTGKGKRLEALNIKIVKENESPGEPAELVSGAITYRAHCQTYGWQDPVSDGETAGTINKSKRLEAVEISLTGGLAEAYDIYYQAHSASFGDLGWAKNGERAGSEGYGKSIEALRIRLVKKGSPDAPAQSGRSFLSPTRKGTVTYTSHVQSYGWMDAVADGQISGTQGKSKRMEAFRVYLDNPGAESGRKLEGSIEYQAHSQSFGWMDWQTEGETAGTEGKSKRLEAVRIRLTGEMAEKYDVWYRVHCASWGTLGWAKNGETAGTVGYYRSIESLEIRILPKGSEGYPQDKAAALEGDRIGTLTVTAEVSGQSEASFAGSGGTVGSAGKGKALEAVRLQIESGNGLYEGSVIYRTSGAGSGWSGEVTDGAYSGQPGSGKGLNALEIRLSGELAAYNDVYYRVFVPKLGWLGWAKNGQTAGISGGGAFIEALQVVIQPRTAPAPSGAGSGAYWTSLGEFRVTGYCGCAVCNGHWGGWTATGTVPAEGRTIAVAPWVIPYGTKVRIAGMSGVFTAEDTGGFANQNSRQIDVFFADHNRALQYGMSYREIWVQK